MSICTCSVSYLGLILLHLGFLRVALEVLLQVHVIFEGLGGGREGDRGKKLNHQTTKHTHGEREEEKERERKENRISALSELVKNRCSLVCDGKKVFHHQSFSLLLLWIKLSRNGATDLTLHKALKEAVVTL